MISLGFVMFKFIVELADGLELGSFKEGLTELLFRFGAMLEFKVTSPSMGL
jgi:hypothetical protein